MRNRPLEKIHAIVYLDALMVKMRVDGKVDTRAVYLATGVTMAGQKDILGSWFGSRRRCGRCSRPKGLAERGGGVEADLPEAL